MDYRKLTALIAEKVMGCQVYDSYEARRLAIKAKTYHAPDVTWDKGAEAFHLNEPDEGVQYLGWSPWEDMGDAWMAVRAMQVRGYEYNIDGPAANSGFVNHRTSFRGPREQWITMQAKTSQLAICLAALKVVGVDVKEFEVQG